MRYGNLKHDGGGPENHRGYESPFYMCLFFFFFCAARMQLASRSCGARGCAVLENKEKERLAVGNPLQAPDLP